MGIQRLETRWMLAAIPFSDLQVIASDAADVRSAFATDLDRDGDLDVLAASLDDDTLRWYVNDGVGGFGPASVITSSADGARAVHAADLDRDGDLDVLLASFYDNTIAWYANDGSGGFAAAQVIDASSLGASSVFAADVDRDGDQDVLAASRNDDTVAWYVNDGLGGFGTRQVITAGADRAVSVHAADVDRDGDLDVLSASFGDDTLAWYENDGTPAGAGDWTAHPISTTADGAYAVHTADLDRDGDLDVLSASANDDTITWYANDGSGGFGTSQVISSTATGATSVYAMDLDKDGDVDVVSGSAGNSRIAWHENLGGGTFNPEKLISTNANGVWSVLAADIDRDGDQDVLAALSGSDTIAWLVNESIHDAPTFGEMQIVVPETFSARDVFTADLDGDGDQDVLSASRQDGKIAWYENRVQGATIALGPQQVITTSALGARSVFASDLDGDGDPDVLSASAYDDKIAWYENRLDEATEDIGPQQVISTSADFAEWAITADLDGDGDQDILSASSNDDKIAWYENRLDEATADFGPQQAITISADHASLVFASDLDGDGDPDVLSASSADDTIAWFENRLDEAAGDFGPEQVITTNASGARAVFASDLDGDGNPDVLSASRDDDKVAWYENRLDQETMDFGPEQVITTNADGAYSVVASDLDGDGDPDVLSASRFDDKIAWYENRLDEATSDFGPQQVITSLVEAAFPVFTSDLDGDGDPDVLSASLYDDRIAWYENRLDEATADFGPQQPITSSVDDAKSVYAIDLDGDGDPDVVSASYSDDKIAWYENRGNGLVPRFGPQQVITTDADGAQSVTVSDVDGDGDADILSASHLDHKIAWYENRLDEGTGDFGPQQVITTSAGRAHAVFVSDLDGDGDQDVLSASEFGLGKIAWYENRLDQETADFGPQQVISTDVDSPRSVFAADLDGDGDDDVLSASYGDDTVAWYENRLDEEAGDFGPQQVIAADVRRATSITASDLDRDGDPDVLAASFLGDKVFWYENRLDEASGEFGPPQVITTSADGASSVFTSDLDGDGDPDVLSASYEDGKIAWYANRLHEGTADFGPQQVITNGANGANSVFASDLDLDGDPDVFSASSFFIFDAIAWYENDRVNFSVETADLVPDRVHNADTVSVLSLTTSHLGKAGDHALEIANVELVFEDVYGQPLTSMEVNRFIDALDVYYDTDSSGHFNQDMDTRVAHLNQLVLHDGIQNVSFAPGDPMTQVEGARTADLYVVVQFARDASLQPTRGFRISPMPNLVNGILATDVKTGETLKPHFPSPLTASSFLSVATLPFDEGELIVEGPKLHGLRSAYPADLDGDGNADILSASFDDDKIAWYENRLDEATGDFGQQQVITTSADGATSVYASDLNGDGAPDVLTASFRDDKISWYENRLDDAPGDFGPEQEITTVADGASSVYASDLDGDGDLDVLSASHFDNKVAWYENRLSEPMADFGPQQVISTTAHRAASVYAADLDGDGDQDVLSASDTGTEIEWYENRLDEPTGDFGPAQVINSNAEGAGSVFASDLDGDGDQDVLSASANDKVAWYENRLDEPSGDFGPEQLISTSADGAAWVFTSDLDGDGDPDVLSASSRDDTIAWYENRLNDTNGNFGPQQVISDSAAGALAVFVDDLDGDGDPDVLSASRDDDKIAWHENRLDEESADFGPVQVVISSTDFATSVFSADLDSDGDPDVLSASFYDDKIAWYENRLDEVAGDFGPQQVISTNADGARSVFTSDLDGDGDWDVLSASANNQGKIAWYENRLDEVTRDFGPQQVISLDVVGADSVFAADLDGDGDVDVLSASSFNAFAINENKIAWYENRLDEASEDFGPQQVITSNAIGASSVFASDLDGDGDYDVLSASRNDDKIAWYENRLNEAMGDFSLERVITTSFERAGSVFASDLDRDGDQDVVAASFVDDTIAWYENRLNEGLGGFAPQQVITITADGANSVFTSDLDGDGDEDVLSTSSNDDKTAWYENRLNEVTADFGPQQVISRMVGSPRSVFPSDLDGDGDHDVILASSAESKITWYENTLTHRSALFTKGATVFANALGAAAVQAADLDGDGDIDLVSASSDDNTIAWYPNLGGGNFLPRELISTSADGVNAVHTADLDRDGDIDLLTASRDDHTIAWFENDGAGAFAAEQVLASDANEATFVDTADLNRDGYVDVLAASFGDDTLRWFANDGAGGFGPAQTITTTADGAQSVHAADLDRDGDVDVISASANDNTVAWYENDGSGSFGLAQLITSSAAGAASVFAADLDQDGDLDVLSASANDNTIAWFQNDGTGGFSTAHLITTLALGATHVHAADVDHDGDLDVLSASSIDDTIAWYENDGGDGTPGFGPRQTISTTADGAAAVIAADLDRDGDLDVVSASRLDHRIAWYENGGGQFALPTTDTAPAIIGPGEVDDLLKIDAVHRGRPGDHDAQVAWFELLLEQSPGDRLSSTEANGLIDNLRIYRDDGSGGFDAANDTLVTTVDTLALANGRQRIELADGEPAAQSAFGAPATYFVVVQVANDLAGQPLRQFRVTHLTDGSSLVEDRLAHVPLALEDSANVASAVVGAGLLGDMDLDLQVDVDDVPAFVLALVDPAGYQAQYGLPAVRFGDIDGDGTLDVDDIDDFVTLLVGPAAGSGQQTGSQGGSGSGDAASSRDQPDRQRDAAPTSDTVRVLDDRTADRPAVQQTGKAARGLAEETSGWIAWASPVTSAQEHASLRGEHVASPQELLGGDGVGHTDSAASAAPFQPDGSDNENRTIGATGAGGWRVRRYVDARDTGPIAADGVHDAVWAARIDWQAHLRVRR